jgi:hypothetical protein
MTGPSNGKPTDLGPVEAQRDRVDSLARYIGSHAGQFTTEALRQAAIDAGYTPDEIEQASARATAAAAVAPIRAQARWIVLGAYALVWLLFAFVYLNSDYAFGPVYQGILTVSLLIALGLSLLWLRWRRPDPSAVGRATAVFLALPVILLVGVAGLCLPFVGSR